MATVFFRGSQYFPGHLYKVKSFSFITPLAPLKGGIEGLISFMGGISRMRFSKKLVYRCSLQSLIFYVVKAS